MPTIFIVAATPHKSSSLTGLVYLTPLPSVIYDFLQLRLSYAPKQPLSWVGSGHKAPYLSVKGLRSFIGAYKVLSRILPHYSQLVDPLESALANLQSHDHVKWDECLRQRFAAAQDALKLHKSIVLPRASDQLWIVTDG